ncbi:hypothetical protein B0A52_08657 [Exophiala mesophila]|uniref:FAD/NAD(P)-binding domain-containing protein n=1 Tax=Exophiala mesophila TaxID=212818 RepID=A0A438MWE5_EXOME|nr:hypothetical protein B0A52_08657 [Exophiala mesophila]
MNGPSQELESHGDESDSHGLGPPLFGKFVPHQTLSEYKPDQSVATHQQQPGTTGLGISAFGSIARSTIEKDHLLGSKPENVLVNDPPALSLKPQMVNGTAISINSDNEHENEWYRSTFSASGYTINEQPLHTRRPIRMLIVGAGAAGLQIAYKALRQLQDVGFTIYEKNADVGGTWLENRNPNWKSYYASAGEIRQYLKSFAVENDLEKFVNFGHRIEDARWDQDAGLWRVKGRKDDGTEFLDHGEILASCHGVLNSWKYPDIPGLQSFKGQILHSAAWDDKVELKGKRVAVVGGGSSAVQIIPSIQPEVKKLYPFLRSPVWITAGFGAKHAAPGGVNFDYSQEQKEEFAKSPTALDKYCRDVEGELNKRFTLMHLESEDQKVSREFVAESMFHKLEGDQNFTSRLIPKFALGCRRMTPGSDYLQSLKAPNVEVVFDSAAEVTSNGLLDSSGNLTEVDVIIFATGFDTSFSPAYSVTGQNGRNLREEWKDIPKAYMSVMADGFPNMFHFPGPNGPASHGSVLPVLEWHTRYMFKLVSYMQRMAIKSLVPSSQAVSDFYVHTHELLKRTAWSSACRSWFKNGKVHGPVTAIWPGSRLHCFEALKEPRFEDFQIEYVGDGNRFQYLGNGYTQTELNVDGNPVWYFDLLKEELDLGFKAFSSMTHG